jgi:hypothetical protein
MKKYIAFFVSVFLLSFVNGSFAETSESLNIQGLRQRAMGSVGVASSRGESALLTNPANLAYSTFAFKLPRISVDINQETLENQTKLEDLVDPEVDDEMRREFLFDLAPLSIALKQRLYPGLSLVTKGFGAGVFVENNILAELDSSSDDVELNLRGNTDIVPAIGFAQEVDFLDKKTALGVSAKFITRYRIYDQTTGDNEFKANLNDLIRILGNKDNKKAIESVEVKGVGFDIGFLRPVDSYRFGKGHWGIAAQNIGATLKGTKVLIESEVESDVDYEEKIDMTSTVGCSLKNTNLRRYLNASKWFVGDTTYAVDYAFISNDSDYRKNLNLGIEQELLGKYLKLRGGVNDGYIVGGVGVDLYIWKFPLLHFNYVNYTEEYGEKTGENPVQYQAFEVGVLF